MPATIPIGTANRAARPIKMSVPAMALAMPPPASPTGFGMCVKNSRVSAGRPCLSTKNRMNPSGTSASATDRAQKATTAPERTRRRREVVIISGCRGRRRARHPLQARRADPPDENPRQGVDDDGHQEQNEADLDQRVQV